MLNEFGLLISLS